MSTGLTLDAGALITWERRRTRTLELMRRANERRLVVTVPVVAITEWWRGRSDWREQIRASFTVEPMDESLARTAGELIAAVRGATAIDAIVVASAARRGDVILTSDPTDLAPLADWFGSLRVLAV